MVKSRRTFLAWFNLTYEVRRLVTAIAGVSFAVILIFIFTGFMNALFDSQVQLLNLFNGDIVVISRLKDNMFVPEQFARRRLYQAQAFDGVEQAYAVYTTTGNWKNPETKATRPLRILAFNPSEPALPLPGIEAHLERLKAPWTVLMDEKARPEVGPKTAGVFTELEEQQVQIVGTFSLGTDFASGNGNVIMSDQNFLRYFANLGPEADSRTLNTVDIGLLKLRPGVDAEMMAAQLRDRLPADVSVLSKAGFVAQELTYWQKNTNIGFVFSLLSSMSFVVGVILVYQILYTDVAEHWAEYATLKAMGYANHQLLRVVFEQALILSVIGFGPGVLISLGLYRLTADATGLLMQMTVERALLVFVGTVMMCLISAAIAVRKVLMTDPAEVFG